MSLDVFWHEDVLLHDPGEGVFEAPPPNGRQCLTMAGFRELGAAAGSLFDRLLLVQEGGYAPTYAAARAALAPYWPL